MTRTEYLEITNSEETYEDIADILKEHGSMLIGWTDEIYTHYDILFLYKTRFYGTNIQGGIKSGDLFVSIMRKGAFAFKVNDNKKSSGYIAEKLNLSNNETTEKLTELINGVMKEIGGNKK